MQLNKYLALCGVASRRKANYLIIQGRIKVNDQAIHKLGIVIQTEDDVRLDGHPLRLPQHYRYVLLNKPADTITSVYDTHGRKTVLDIIGSNERLFPVGRLDKDTEGVLLITNDGDLAYRLTHPRYEIVKVYHAWVDGQIDKQALQQLNQGVQIDPGIYVSGEASRLSQSSHDSLIEIQVHEGKKRQIKRMMKGVGYPVKKLIRVNFAGLTSEGMHKGEWRDLTEIEIDRLYRMVGLK